MSGHISAQLFDYRITRSAGCGAMTIEQNTGTMTASFARKLRDRIFAWIQIAGEALKPLSKFRFARPAIGIKQYVWVGFAIVLAGNIAGFNYYQARITRYYIGVLLTNLVRIDEDIAALDDKLNQLSAKIDELSVKLDKRPLPPPPIQTTPPSPAKPRSKQ
jgi:hypothetical protein